MKRGYICAPDTPGAVYWRQELDEQQRQERSQLTKKDIKRMLKEKDFSAIETVSFPLVVYRCESCGAVEFFAQEAE